VYPAHVLKPHEWRAGVFPVGKVREGTTQYQLVFKASLWSPGGVHYSDVVTHAETFEVIHVPAAPKTDTESTASSGRVDLKNLRDFQAALSREAQKLRAMETMAPSIREGLEEMLTGAAQMSGEWFQRDTANANPIDGNPNYLIQLLRDTADELNRDDSPLRSEEGIKALEAEFISRAEADVKVAEDLVRDRFLRMPILFGIRANPIEPEYGTLDARQLIGLCDRWEIQLSDDKKEALLRELDPAKVRGKVFDRLWQNITADGPRLEHRPAHRAGFLMEAALTKRIEPSPISAESRIGNFLDTEVLTGLSEMGIGWSFYPNLRGLPSILATYQVAPYRLQSTTTGPHLASAVEKGN